MAQPITQFAVVEVAKPNIGENRPSRVRADVTINLSVRKEIKSEWENLRKHDVCFLMTVKPPNPIGKIKDRKNNTLSLFKKSLYRKKRSFYIIIRKSLF